DQAVKHATPNASPSVSKVKDDEESKSPNNSLSRTTTDSAVDQHATTDSKPTLNGSTPGNSRLAGLPALALAIVAASF
ncbi:hypothetical protein LPJ71_006046, partial [Coemansia sp. S17]